MTTATLSKKQQEQQEREDAQDFLRDVFSKQEEGTVWTSLKWVSNSGMSRDIKTLTVIDGKIVDISWYVAKACSVGTLKERNGQRVVRVNGCGMDMGFHLVYSLSYALYNTDENYKDAGYYLRHEWI